MLPRLSWSMDPDGVVTVAASWDDGPAFSFLDIFRRPLIEFGGMTRGEARAFQAFAAERICSAWNTDKSAAQIALDHVIDPQQPLTEWGQGHNAACTQIAHEIARRFKL